MYFSVDILNNMDSYKEQLDMTFALRQLPIYLMTAFLILSLLMVAELAVENWQILSLRKKLRKAEEQVMQYKAKLYDQSQETPAPSTIAPFNLPMGDEPDILDDDDDEEDEANEK